MNRRALMLSACLAALWGCDDDPVEPDADADVDADTDGDACDGPGTSCDVEGDLRCSPDSSAVEACAEDVAGCLVWVERDECGPAGCDDSGDDAVCVNPCADPCDDEDASRCQGEVVQACLEQAAGCLGWQDLQDCAETAQTCDDAAGDAVCLDTCADACEEDELRCADEVIEACVELQNGCLGWEASVDCADSGQFCDATGPEPACVASCVDQCTPAGESQCSGQVVQVCATQASGCLGWDDDVDCALTGATCDDAGPDAVCLGGCVDPPCEDVEASCGDGHDNDGDGLTDCDDPSCFGTTGCTTETNCGDHGDNDDDGVVDCFDTDCRGRRPCEAIEVTCADAIDNDADGTVDCDDPNCFGGAACMTETNCGDDADNDDDGAADCADADCAGVVECRTYQGLFEVFEAGAPIDLEGWSLVFAPDAAEPMGYEWIAVDGLAAFPVAPGSGAATATLTLDDSDFEAYALSVMSAFTFYDIVYTSFFVGSNGHVTFRSGEGWPMVSISDLFLQPTIAVLGTDLDAGEAATPATVTVDETADSVAITYESLVRSGHGGEPNDVQIVLNADGTIELHYLELAAPAAFRSTYVGIARGPGTVPLPAAVDFVTLPPEADCDDGIDEDLDGLTDCADPDCDGVMPCVAEADCDDRVDDDHDGLTDCADADCAAQPVCAVEGSCANPIVVSSFPFVISGTDFAADFLDRQALGGAGCVTRTGSVEAVFAIEVEAGQTLVVSEHGGLDAVLSLQAGCGDAVACVYSDDLDTDESGGRTYSVTADGTVHVIVESYFAAPSPDDYEIHIGLCSGPAPVINEVGYDDDMTDDSEFVELQYGCGAFDLTGYSLVHINGIGAVFVWEADLAGRSIGDDGFFVIGPSEMAEADAHWFADLGVDNAAEEDVIQNGGSSTEHVGDSLVLYWHYGLADQAVIDAVEWEGDSAGPGEGTPATGIVYGSWNNSIGRFPDGDDTGDNGADFVTSWWATPGEPNTQAEPSGYVRLAYSAFGEEAAPRLPRTIPDATPAGIDLTMDGVGAVSGYPTVPSTIADIQVGVRVTHPDRSDLDVSLASPAGTVVQLQAGAGGGLADLEAVWDLYMVPAESLAAFDGQDPRGATWRLNVADAAAGDAGSIREWVIWVR